MNFPLRLRYDDSQRRPATAWLLVGPSAADWTAELAAWQTPLAEARFYAVPTSRTDRRPCGLFVVGAGPHDGRASPRALPYAAVERRLYVPCESRLDPLPTAAELAELLDEELYVWHPQAGLVALPATSARRANDLIIVPSSSSDGWTAAVPGIALNGKLVSVEAAVTPTVQDVLNDARGDIGTQPLDRSRLPPAPHEPREGLVGDVGRAVGQGIAKLAQWVAQQGRSVGRAVGARSASQASGATGERNSDTTGSGSGWLRAVENWANRQLQQISKSLEATRNRELHRLMNLLQTNPDEGLRFALPMGGGEHRGLAPPSGTLGPHDVNFTLGGMRGGQAADFWDVPAEMRRKLHERYRELAAREIALGRHRRAAYIFASLLGDLHSAATTLADGGHCREAAALYQERLSRPELAADCLRRGGLRQEALAIYDRLGRHEIVGDLYLELEQEDDADAAYRRAVEQQLAADDVLAAAKVLELKIHRPEEAYERLAAAWPESKQSQTCLVEAFALAARQAWHEQATALIAATADKVRPAAATAPLVDVLAHEARGYPNAVVRAHAADRTRIVVAARLGASIDSDEAARLVAAVARLEPTDRLLSRDGNRFAAEHRRGRSQSTNKAAYSVQIAPTLVRELQLPMLAWSAAAASDDAIFAAGFRDRELVVVRTDWSGAASEEPIGEKWKVEIGHQHNPIILVADAASKESLVVHVVGAPPLAHLRWFKASDRFPVPISAGPHRGVSATTYGACRSGSEMLHVVDYGGETLFVASAHLNRAQLGGVATIDLLKLRSDDGEIVYPLPTAVCGESLCVGIGRTLCFADSRRGVRQLNLAHSATQLVASAPRTRSRLAVSMRQGGWLLWGDDDRALQAAFATEMASPQIALTRDGTLVAASADEIEFYSTSDGRLRLRARTRGPGVPILAVVAARRQNRFAALLNDGRMLFYDLPA